jgi:gluconolactonase
LSSLHAVSSSFRRSPFHDSITATVDDSGRPLLSIDSEKPFIVANSSFTKLLGPNASVAVLASKDYPFAHEAGVYVRRTNEVWFTSTLLDDGTAKRVELSRINLATGELSIVDVSEVKLGNGACPYDGGILFCDQGTMTSPSRLVWVNPSDPSRSKVVLDNYASRGFNSLNDVIVLEHPSGDLVFFTDPPYGREQGFRPPNNLPPAVHVFDPSTGCVRMLSDDFRHPNGIAFSPDGSTCYITDTSHIHGNGTLDPSLPSTMWVIHHAASELISDMRLICTARLQHPTSQVYGTSDCSLLPIVASPMEVGGL